MPAEPEVIPLLTLPAVLFPGTFLPLQLVEEKHRDLLRDCAGQSRSLGVILTPGESSGGRPFVPCTTGCLASIALLLQDNDGDEQFVGAVLHGEQRIRVVDFVCQEPYLTGRVEVLDDYADYQAARHTRQAAELFKQYLEMISRQEKRDAIDLSLPDDPALASYLLASVLYIPLETKQRWLESPSVTQRLEEELAYLRAECERQATFSALARKYNTRYTMPDYRTYGSMFSLN